MVSSSLFFLALSLGSLGGVSAAPTVELLPWPKLPGFSFPGSTPTTTTPPKPATTTAPPVVYTPTPATTKTTPAATKPTTTTTKPTTPASSTYPSSGSTRNDLLNNICRPITVIFARGTGESGNVGAGAGPPWFNAMSSLLGDSKFAVQGVEYAASTAGIAGDSAGNAKVGELIALAVSKCPGTQVVLGGYSQGAMIIHRGTASLPASSYAAIAAVVLFGDPFNGQPFASSISADKVKTFCHQGDDVCKGQYSITSDHLNYSNDAPEAARFVQGKVSL